MSGKARLGWVLGIGLCSCVSAETTDPVREFSDNGCTQQLRPKEVLVLDLEPMRTQPETAQEFVTEYAGEFMLFSTKPEVIITRSRASKDPDGVIRRAQKFGAKNGCDLVLVLKTGPYFGRQRNTKFQRFKDGGYAIVVMGQRTARKY
jgi:hypothetical protein